MLVVARLVQTSKPPAYFILRNFLTPCLLVTPFIRDIDRALSHMGERVEVKVHWKTESSSRNEGCKGAWLQGRKGAGALLIRKVLETMDPG